jgi:acid phosphatase type 7
VGAHRRQCLRWAIAGSFAAALLCAEPTPGGGAAHGTRTLVAVGDIASCEVTADEAVADLVARTPGTLALLGDTVYDNGTVDEYLRCFLPRWGPFLQRTRAALGNHEYANGASDAAAAKTVLGLPNDGWYSYELGDWHVIVLNSNCEAVGGCDRGSRQWLWLRADLARSRAARCVLAYWHHPRFSSGEHGSDVRYAPFWDLLAAARADVVLSGHDHDYERFAPLKGIRSFVVGTGGRSQRPFGAARPRSVVRQTGTYGVLRLTLRPEGYSWAFLRASGEPFGDTGTGRCR